MKLPPYNGGKSGNGTYQQIINHIPPHQIYVAPFAGHCGVFQKIRRSPISVLNDRDPQVIERWKLFPPPGCIVTTEYPVTAGKFQTSILPAVVLRNEDYASIISRFKDTFGGFLYCDPPFPKSKCKSKGKTYLFDWMHDDLHKPFLEQCITATCNVMISSYENDMYNDMLNAWHTHRFKVMTRKGIAEQIFYKNSEPPKILHDYRYLGKDFRQRERIKLKVRRFRNKLATMPEDERCAILSDTINHFRNTAQSLIKL